MYLDASAITKLVVREQESVDLQARVQGRLLATSRVSVVEVGKAVARVDPAADVGGVLALFAFVDLDSDLASLAARTGPASLRALDAIHVAAALRLGPEVDAFVTYDMRQAEVAAAAGLRVVAPGRDGLDAHST